MLFGRADDAFEHYEIYETRLGNDHLWSMPVKPSFAEQWSNADPHFSPDGTRVFFISNRPDAGVYRQMRRQSLGSSGRSGLRRLRGGKSRGGLWLVLFVVAVASVIAWRLLH